MTYDTDFAAHYPDYIGAQTADSELLTLILSIACRLSNHALLRKCRHKPTLVGAPSKMSLHTRTYLFNIQIYGEITNSETMVQLKTSIRRSALILKHLVHM